MSAVSSQSWWQNTKGLQIETAEQLETLMESNMDKFIMLDFYMEQCYWCQQFQPEWNKLYDDFQ
jgi:thiol:disulfide interchange protein